MDEEFFGSGTRLSEDSGSGETTSSEKASAQPFDFKESLVIATIVSIVLLLFACLLLWLCNKTHQIVQDGDLEKGEKLFEEMLNPDYKEAFLNKKTGIYNKSDRKRYIIQKMKDDFKIKKRQEEEQKAKAEKRRKREQVRKSREEMAGQNHDMQPTPMDYDNRGGQNNNQQIYYNIQQQSNDLEPMAYGQQKAPGRGKDMQNPSKMKSINNEHNQQIIAGE